MQTVVANLLILILGWSAGALINYLSEALPYRRRLVRPFCVACGEEQSFTRYWFWPRRCHSCGVRRSWSTWLVEIVAAGLTLWLWHTPPPALGFLGGFFLLLYFGVVVLIDLKYRLILHPVSLAGVVLGLAIGIHLHGLLGSLLGGAAGYGIMYAFYFLGGFFAKWLARRRGQVIDEEALGFGDVNLSGVLGLMLGWPIIIPGLILAVLIGGLFSIFFLVVMLALRRYRLLTPIPYGPFLVSGAVLILFFSRFISNLFGP
jgi:leader peptidase (prepilin peptidase) / N-methyltransferase